MVESAPSFLTPWANFYVMMGSSAAALTGLMFVVITLVGDADRGQTSADGISTYSTPTVMHFAAALLISALMSAPWRTLGSPAIALGLAGLVGIVYLARIGFRTAQITAYRADAEDWCWYVVLPLLSYVAIFATSVGLLANPRNSLFLVAGSVVLLIFIGIHNAWDVVTYLAARSRDNSK